MGIELGGRLGPVMPEMSPAVAKAEGLMILMIKMQKLLDSVSISEESAQQVQTCFDKFQDGLVLEGSP